MKRARNVILIIVGVLVLGCVALLAVPSRDQATATPTAAVAAAAPAPTTAGAPPAPTATPAPAKPTAAPVPTATPAPPPTPVPQLKIGDTLEIKNWRVKVLEVQRVPGDLVWSQFGNKTPAIGEWFIVIVELTNTGAENFTLNTWDFELRTAAGATVKHTTEGAAYAYPAFKKMVGLGKQIPPGATVATPLLYDIAKGTQGISLVFAQAKDKPIDVG